MGITARIGAAYHALTSRSLGGGNGYASSVSVISAGPTFSDAFQSVRGPSAVQLVEQYRSLVFTLSNINAKAVWSVPLRLYSTAGPGKPTPRSACCPRALNARQIRSMKGRKLPWITRSLAGAESVHEITEHPLLDLLDSPDPDGYFDRSQLLGLITRYMDVTATAYCQIQPGPLGVPAAIMPLQSQFVYPCRSLNYAKIDSYRYFDQTIKPENMLRFRLYPSLKDPWGGANSPAEASVQYIGLEDRWVSIQSQLLGNGPRPELLVTAKDQLVGFGSGERDRLEQEMNTKHSRGKAGRVLVVDGALDVKPLSFPPSDLAGLNISEYTLERAANAFDVPLALLSKDTNLANMQASEKAHAKHGVEPRCHIIASVLTALARKMDDRLFFAFDPACDEDDESEARVFDMALKNGCMTINEVRAEEGYEAVEWGDEPWISSTLTQPSTIAEQHEAGLAASAAIAANGGQPLPTDDPEDAPGKPPTDKPVDDNTDDKQLTRHLTRVLRKFERTIDETPPVTGWSSDGVTRTRSLDPKPDARGQRGPGPDGGQEGHGRDEQVPPASGDADPPEPQKVVPSADESDLGGDPGNRGADPDIISEPDGLQRSDGDGDDASDVGILG